MKQLQHGIYSPTLGERNWGEEINQNFEALDNLVGSVISTKDKCDLLATKVQDNTELINDAKDSLQEGITNAVNDLQGKIDILNNDALALKYRVDELSNKDRIEYANEADLAILAVSANSAKKLENSLTIGGTVFDGSSSKNVPIDDVVTHNSTNLINSRAVYNAVYNGLEAKQDKATTLSGYNITDAYTKSEINNMLSQGDNTSRAYVDIRISELVNSAPEALDTINELAAALGNDPDFATTIVNQLRTKADADHTHSDYITGITKEMVTDALGYTPPEQDTNTTYSAGSNLALDGTTFNVSSDPSFDSITVGGYRLSIG